MTSSIPGAQQAPETLSGETEEDRLKALLQQSEEAWKKQSTQLAWYVLAISIRARLIANIQCCMLLIFYW